MRRLAILSAALLALTALLAPQRSTSSEKPKAAEESPRGKYVGITFKVPGQAANALLKKVMVKQLGGRTFLVGEYASEVHEAYELWKGVREPTRLRPAASLCPGGLQRYPVRR
jgi:hypothetical protein